MSWSANLWLYFVMVFGIIVLPGMDMAFVSASTLAGGLRSGVAALAGMVAGGICHTVMGALGMAVILQTWPLLYQAMVIAGALYFAWIGYSLMRMKKGFSAVQKSSPASAATVFRRAMMTCLLNPKAYIFMLAVFPQFIKPAYGSVWMQATALGAIGAVSQVAVYGSVAFLTAFATSRAHSWTDTSQQASLWMARAVGLLFLIAAMLTLVQVFRGAV